MLLYIGITERNLTVCLLQYNRKSMHTLTPIPQSPPEYLNIVNSKNVQSSEERENERKEFTSEEWIRNAERLALNEYLPGVVSRIRSIKEE